MKRQEQTSDSPSLIEGLKKMAKRHKHEGGLPQAEKFEAAAHELGCDEIEDRFKEVLRKLAKPKS